MGRAALHAAIGVLAASIALALITAASPPAPRSPVPQISGAGARSDADTLRRCRTVTEPDPACARAWDEKRRRFFRQEKDER